MKIGEGYKAQTQGECKNIEVEIGGLKQINNAWLFYLGGIDLMLGITWLTKIEGMWVDWVQQLMRFKLNGEWVELKGQGDDVSRQGALQNLLSRPRQEIVGLFVTIGGTIVANPKVIIDSTAGGARAFG